MLPERKVSDLIKTLERLKRIHGDLTVYASVNDTKLPVRFASGGCSAATVGDDPFDDAACDHIVIIGFTPRTGYTKYDVAFLQDAGIKP